MTRQTGLFIASIACILVVVVALLLFLHVIRNKAMLYLIPGGYKGWIVVQFEDPTCPPLPREGTFLVVMVSPTGRACTSNSRPAGIDYVQFDYIYGDSRRVRLAASSSSGGDALVRLLAYQPDEKWEIEFVGTKDEFMQAGTPPYPWHKNLKNSGQNR